MTGKPVDPRLLRRADQHRQLSRRRSGDEAGRRRSIRCSITTMRVRQGLDQVGRCRSSPPRQPRATRSIGSLETHAHADHLSGAPYVKAQDRRQGRHRRAHPDVQKIFRPVFNATDLKARRQRVRPAVRRRRALPARRPRGRGHAHAGPHAGRRQLQDRRCGVRRRYAVHAGLRHGARRLPWRRRRTLLPLDPALLALPPRTRLFMCHDYKAPGRDHYAWETTVAEERAHNVHVRDGIERGRIRRHARGARRHARRRRCCCCRRSR